MLGNATLAGVRPSAVGELNRVPLVAAVQTFPVPAIGAQGEPQRIVEGPGTNVGLDLGTPGLAIGMNTVEAVGEQVPPFDAKHDDRRKAIALLQIVGIVVDHLRTDGSSHLRARVEHKAVERQRLANWNASRQRPATDN